MKLEVMNIQIIGAGRDQRQSRFVGGQGGKHYFSFPVYQSFLLIQHHQYSHWHGCCGRLTHPISGFAIGKDSVVCMGSGIMSVEGNGKVSQSVVGSGSISAVGMDTWSGSGVVRDDEWCWTLAAGSSSTSATVKVPLIYKAKLMYCTHPACIRSLLMA